MPLAETPSQGSRTTYSAVTPPARRVWIGLPAYNEEASIPKLFARFAQELSPHVPVCRIVLYDDGCTDRTVEAALAWRDRLDVQIIGRPQNMGLGQGLRSLMAHIAQSGNDDDVLIIMDCDDTHHPHQIAAMLARIDAGNDVVIASRYRPGATVAGVASHRRVLSLGAALLFKLIHPCKGVLDYTCGYRAYRVASIRRALARYGERLVSEPGFAAMVEVLLKLNQMQVRMSEIPLELHYDLKQGPSKMNVAGNTGRLLRKLIEWRMTGLA